MLNARITNKTFKKWNRINFFSKRLFQSFNAVYPQNKETEKYLKKLSCKKIIKLGNLKFTKSINKINSGIDKNIYKKKTICVHQAHIIQKS